MSTGTTAQRERQWQGPALYPVIGKLPPFILAVSLPIWVMKFKCPPHLSSGPALSRS